ncbi:disulfide bond formation protein B [Marinobacter maritimus]|uniref:disulfide bond formation protein B n=1 Tax=Marinobacter maritimus TaxID=277961 RepID=UPI00164264AC|nr:disulfide bond formation protein B [Marinobacter maritimus]
MTNTSQTIPWGLLLTAWLLALVSSLSAIYIGEVLGQAPCVLCWFQRAFMFPLAVILAVACYYSDFNVWRYALPLAVIGSLFALAHSLLYVGLLPQPIQPCTATGPSCSGARMTIFGGLPLPFLSLGIFVAIIILLLEIRRRISS